MCALIHLVSQSCHSVEGACKYQLIFNHRNTEELLCIISLGLGHSAATEVQKRKDTFQHSFLLPMHQSGPPRLSGLCQITDRLYLSNRRAADDVAVVSSFKITCIINVTEKSGKKMLPEVEYIHVPVADSPVSPLSEHFDQVADKIHSVGERSGITLVHCNAGVSRSSTLCMVYLMKHRNMTLVEAHRWMKSCRPIVRPNNGFWKQLIQYESRLRGCTTVRMVSSPLGEIPDIYEEETKNMLPL